MLAIAVVFLCAGLGFGYGIGSISHKVRAVQCEATMERIIMMMEISDAERK